jgi:hypothetical protein
MSFKSFDKDLLVALSKVKREEFLEIELQFKPSVFVHLIKTTLTTNTRSTLIRENRKSYVQSYRKLWRSWCHHPGHEFGYQES